MEDLFVNQKKVQSEFEEFSGLLKYIDKNNILKEARSCHLSNTTLTIPFDYPAAKVRYIIHPICFSNQFVPNSLPSFLQVTLEKGLQSMAETNSESLVFAKNLNEDLLQLEKLVWAHEIEPKLSYSRVGFHNVLLSSSKLIQHLRNSKNIINEAFEKMLQHVSLVAEALETVSWS